MREQSILRGPHRLVVGGGIGAGKSTVASLLAQRGASLIEADRIGHEVLEPGGSAFEMVAARWPHLVVEGRIDRSALAAVVFADPADLAELEGFTHPAIAGEIRVRVGRFPAEPVVVEIPVVAPLVGEEWVRIWVSAPLEARIERAVERGMEEEDARGRAAAQAPDSTWRVWADVTISNEGNMAELAEEVDRLVAALNGGDASGD